MKHFALLLIILIMSIDCLAQSSWTKTYQDSAIINSIFQYNNSYVGFGSRGSNLYYIRTDKNGDTLIWKNIIDTTFTGNLLGSSGSCTMDGNLIIAGYSNVYTGNTLLRLYKLDTLGNIIWRNFFANTSPNAAQCRLVATPDSGFAIFGTNSLQGYFIKVDKMGNQVFRKDYGYNYTYPEDAILENDGSFVICGIKGMGPQFDNFLLKVDSLGNIVWTKNQANVRLFEAITRINSNYYVMGSWSGYSINLYKYDLSGNLINTMPLNQMGGIYSMKSDSHGNIICSGYITTSDSAGLLKLDTLGNVLLKHTIFSSTFGESYSCFIDNDTNYVYAGRINYKAFISKILNYTGTTNIFQQEDSDNINIYPNPFHGNVIRIDSHEPVMKIELYDTTGKLITTIEQSNQKNEFLISNQQKGLFYLNVIMKNRQSLHKIVSF